MPGLVGLITRWPRARAEATLRRMPEAVIHDPLSESGQWVDEAAGLYLGWVARAGSFGSRMPIRNDRGDVLVFSGEELSDPDPADGRPMHDRHEDEARAAYLIHRYAHRSDFLRGLNGQFHGAVIAGRECSVTLFNDRYGLHRLYYHEAGDAFYFAAEAKAILAVRPDLRRLDPRGLGEFVACGFVMENRTLFDRVHVLPAASAWTFQGGAVARKAVYFHPGEWEEQPPLETGPFYRKLRDVFSQSLPRYWGGGERVAMSLTGGLDGRMIMAWQQQEPASLPCYTFAGMFRECHDARGARQIARVCGQPHQVITVGSQFLAQFPRYAARTVYLTEGNLEVSHAPDLYVSERAREIAPVRVTGNYGGEVLRRVVGCQPQEPLPGLFVPEVHGQTRQAAQTFRALRQTHPLSFAVFRQAPWFHQGLWALEQSQLSVRSPYLDNDLVRLLFRAPASATSSDELSLRLVADGNPALARIPTDLGLGGEGWRWRRVARHRLREFSRKAEYAYDYGMPQWVARIDHALSSLRLERLFLGRHKFYHFRSWYQSPLASYVQAVLLDAASLARPYVERRAVEAVVRDHVKGNRNFTTEIHKLLTLELLHRSLLDTASSGSPAERGEPRERALRGRAGEAHYV